MKKWNATQLKYLMAAVMVLDHIPHITGIVSPLWEGIFTLWPVVWEFGLSIWLWKASSILKFEKLPHPPLSWALIMFAGNSLLNALFASKGVMVNNNIFFYFGHRCYHALDWFSQKRADKKKAVASDWACWSLDFRLSFTEGGITILPFLLISYSCRNRKGLRNLPMPFCGPSC